jgi:hypothetical protein
MVSERAQPIAFNGFTGGHIDTVIGATDIAGVTADIGTATMAMADPVSTFVSDVGIGTITTTTVTTNADIGDS